MYSFDSVVLLYWTGSSVLTNYHFDPKFESTRLGFRLKNLDHRLPLNHYKNKVIATSNIKISGRRVILVNHLKIFILTRDPFTDPGSAPVKVSARTPRTSRQLRRFRTRLGTSPSREMDRVEVWEGGIKDFQHFRPVVMTVFVKESTTKGCNGNHSV